MKYALISYDLKMTNPGDNVKVKNALNSFSDTQYALRVLNDYSIIPQWVTLALPETTFLVEVTDDEIDAKILAHNVKEIILSVHTQIARIFVSFLEKDSIYIINK